MISVLLINSGNDPGIGGNANENAYPPLGILSLATALKHALSTSVEVTLVDCQVKSTDFALEVIRSMRADLVGISMYSTSIANTVRLAEAAVEVGSCALIGNDHAAMHAHVLLNRVPAFQYICLNDVGEETLIPFVRHLMGELDIEDVPRLAFRGDDRSVVETGPTKYQPGTLLDDIPVPQRTLLPTEYWDEYARRFQRQSRRFQRFAPDVRVSTINRARGLFPVSAHETIRLS